MLVKGDFFLHEGEIYKVIEPPIAVKPGKGGAFLQVVAHHVQSHRKINFKFRTEEKIETVNIFNNRHIYLYNDGHIAYFTDDIEYPLKSIELYQFLSHEDDAEQMDGYLNRNPNSIDNKIISTSIYDNIILDIKLLPEIVAKVVNNNGSDIKVCPLNKEYANFEYSIKGPGFVQTGEIILFNSDTNLFIRRLQNFSK